MLGSEQEIVSGDAYVNVRCFACNRRWHLAVSSTGDAGSLMDDVLSRDVFYTGDSRASDAQLVFVSYSHRDDRWLEALQKKLAPILAGRELSLWADTRIVPGTRWREDLEDAIGRAAIAILLVTPNYLASQYIADHELTRILSAAVTREIKVLWIPISASLVAETEIAEFQAAYDPARPLDTLAQGQRNRAWVEIGSAIQHATDRH